MTKGTKQTKRQNIYDLDTSKLTLGETTYRKFCIDNNQKPCTNNSKKAQLRSWSNYIDFTLEGFKLTISAIKSNQSIKNLRREGVIQDRTNLLLDHLSKNYHEEGLFLTSKELHNVICIIPDDYQEIVKKLTKDGYSDNNGLIVIPTHVAKRVEMAVNSMMYSLSLSLLNSMQSRGLCAYSKAAAHTVDGKIVSCSEDEFEKISNITDNVLKRYGLDSKRDLLTLSLDHRMNFYKDISNELERNVGIFKVKHGYQIILNPDLIEYRLTQEEWEKLVISSVSNFANKMKTGLVGKKFISNEVINRWMLATNMNEFLDL